MANWCENKLTVKGTSEELVKLIEEHVIDGELSYKTFATEHRLFGENHFDLDEILNERISEIVFWFSTKWSPVPAEKVCEEINQTYPTLKAELSFFSTESGFWGQYSDYGGEEYYELKEENIEKTSDEFFKFGLEEGFLEKTESGKYAFTHDVPTFRLI